MQEKLRPARQVPASDPRRLSSDTACSYPVCPPSSEPAALRAAARVIVIGGDERTLILKDRLHGLRVFPSARFAGAGSIQHALATISGGSVVLVLILFRWIGHLEYHAIAERCRQRGVRLLRVRGGFSAALRSLDEAQGEC